VGTKRFDLKILFPIFIIVIFCNLAVCRPIRSRGLQILLHSAVRYTVWRLSCVRHVECKKSKTRGLSLSQHLGPGANGRQCKKDCHGNRYSFLRYNFQYFIVFFKKCCATIICDPYFFALLVDPSITSVGRLHQWYKIT